LSNSQPARQAQPPGPAQPEGCGYINGFSGDYREGETPLPIPNREVKLPGGPRAKRNAFVVMVLLSRAPQKRDKLRRRIVIPVKTGIQVNLAVLFFLIKKVPKKSRLMKIG
jgi:hypothetical protein